MATTGMKQKEDSGVYYLTVGTEVSAKYRGAFCEAQIKSIKKNVIYKVINKKTGKSSQLSEDHIRGVPKKGSIVEAQFPDQPTWQEGIIQSAKDRSSYTVVFDDGDERTLARGSLCLKGDRHYAKSETLDNLPLTDPENFGTPVLGAKKNRRRRPADDEYDDDSEGHKTPDRETPTKVKEKKQEESKDRESSSEEEEDDDEKRSKWLSDPLMGKVVIVEPHDKRKHWFPGLIVNPMCYEKPHKLEENHLLVRSFRTGKFFRVHRSSVKEMSPTTMPTKLEPVWKSIVEDAQNWKSTRTVPDRWKIDIRDILDSNSDEEDNTSGDESPKTRKKKKRDAGGSNTKDSEEEKNNHDFLEDLYKFMEDRGSPINKTPVLGYKDLDLYLLFRLVQKRQGSRAIHAIKEWKQIYLDLGIPKPNPAAGYNVKTAYLKYLGAYEEYCDSWKHVPLHSIQPHVALHPLKTQSTAAGKERKRMKTSPKEQGSKPSYEPRKSKIKEKVKAVETAVEGKTRSGRNSPITGANVAGALPPHKRVGQRRRISESSSASDITVSSTKPEKKKTAKGNKKADEKNSPGGPESEPDENSKTDKISKKETGEKRQAAKTVSDTASKRVRRNSTSNVATQYSVGDKLKVKYGQGKTFNLYDAKVLQVKPPEGPGGVIEYFVHYAGWNARHDEWIRPIRIVGYAVEKVGTAPVTGSAKTGPRRPKTPLSSRSTSSGREDVSPSANVSYDISSKFSSIETDEVPDINDDLPDFEVKKPRVKKSFTEDFRHTLFGVSSMNNDARRHFPPVTVGCQSAVKLTPVFEPPHLASLAPKIKQEVLARKNATIMKKEERTSTLKPNTSSIIQQEKKEVANYAKPDTVTAIEVPEKEQEKKDEPESDQERSTSPSEESATSSVSETSEDNSNDRGSPILVRRTSTRNKLSPAYLADSSCYQTTRRKKNISLSEKSRSPTPTEKAPDKKEAIVEDEPILIETSDSSSSDSIMKTEEDDAQLEEVTTQPDATTPKTKSAKTESKAHIDAESPQPIPDEKSESSADESQQEKDITATEYDDLDDAVPNIALEKHHENDEVESAISENKQSGKDEPISTEDATTSKPTPTGTNTVADPLVEKQNEESVEKVVDPVEKPTKRKYKPRKKHSSGNAASVSQDNPTDEKDNETSDVAEKVEDALAAIETAADPDPPPMTENAQHDEEKDDAADETVQTNHIENAMDEVPIPYSIPPHPQDPPSSSKVLLENTPPTTPEQSPNYISEDQDIEPGKQSPSLDSDVIDISEEHKDSAGSASSSGCEQAMIDDNMQLKTPEDEKVDNGDDIASSPPSKKKKRERGSRSTAKSPGNRRSSYNNDQDSESEEDQDGNRRKRRKSGSRYIIRKKKAKARPEPPSAPPPLPREELESMPQDERIALLQSRMAEMRKIYHQLKQEVANIDRKRKRAKRREREAAEAAQSLGSKSGSLPTTPNKPMAPLSNKSEASISSTVAVINQSVVESKSVSKLEDNR